MRIIFAGTPETALPSLRALVEQGHEIVAVLTRPDAPAGRGKKLTASPVASLADQLGLPVLKLKSDYLAIATLGFAEIIRAAVVYEGFGPLTNGSNLLYGFTSFASFNLSLGGTTLHLETVMPFLFSGVCIAIILLLINSTYGRAFKAIRDDEIAAEAMGITAERLKGLGIVDKVIGEPLGGAHRDPQAMAEALRKELLAQLKVLNKLDGADLLARRYERLMSYGVA